MNPKRIQRKRTRGWKMPKNTVYVGRPTKWGNPFKLTPDGWIMCYCPNRKVLDPWIYWSVSGGFYHDDIIELYELFIKEGLARKNLLPDVPDISQLKASIYNIGTKYRFSS